MHFSCKKNAKVFFPKEEEIFFAVQDTIKDYLFDLESILKKKTILKPLTVC